MHRGARHEPFFAADIAVQWCRLPTPASCAQQRARPALYLCAARVAGAPRARGRAGRLEFSSLDGLAMRRATQHLLGEHDFSAFRSSECQARSPVKTLRSIEISRHGAYWRFALDANAFPASHGAQPDRLARDGRIGRARRRLARRGARRRRPQPSCADLCRRRPVLRRTILRCGRRGCPSAAPRWTGCHQVRHPPRESSDEPAHPNQDLRPDPRGRCRCRGRGRRRRGRLRDVRAEPALDQRRARGRAGAAAAAVS